MSLETLLTLGVAGGILVLALVLRVVVVGSVRLVRVLSGRSARRTLEHTVARVTVGERIKRIYQGAAALVIVSIAGLAGALGWLGRSLWAALLAFGRALRPALMWMGRAIRSGATRVAGWWRDAAQPSLTDAREAGIASLTQHPEASGQLDVFARTTPILSTNGSSPETETEREMQLV